MADAMVGACTVLTVTNALNDYKDAPLAYLPAVLFIALRGYLKKKSVQSDEGRRYLLRGLTLGVISALSLPSGLILYSLMNPRLGSIPGRIMLLAFALAGSAVNFFGVRESFRKRTAANALVTLLLVLMQLPWLGVAFAVLIGGS